MKHQKIGGFTAAKATPPKWAAFLARFLTRPEIQEALVDQMTVADIDRLHSDLIAAKVQRRHG